MQKATPTSESRFGPKSDRLRAILLMVIAVTLFSALDTTAKFLIMREHLAVSQVVWARFIVQTVLILALAPAVGLISLRGLFSTSQFGLQMLRSLLMAGTTALNFLAVGHLRLDQTVTIVFLAPLVVALLAGPLLGEWVGGRRMVAILCGFAGILVAVRPGLGAVPPAVLFSFGAMFIYALFMLLTRHMAGFDPPLTTLFYSMFVGAVLGAPLAYVEWVPPVDALSWGLLSILGILGGTGHWLFIHAYRLAPASTVAPFLYFQLLSMVSFGYLVFSDVPDTWTLAGAGVVIASGVYLFHREQVTARAAVVSGSV